MRPLPLFRGEGEADAPEMNRKIGISRCKYLFFEMVDLKTQGYKKRCSYIYRVQKEQSIHFKEK